MASLMLSFLKIVKELLEFLTKQDDFALNSIDLVGELN